MSELSNAARIDLERAIVRGLIRFMKKKGWVPFRAFDGESWSTLRNESSAMEVVFAVDEISLRFVPAAMWSPGPGKLPSKDARDVIAASEHGVLLVLGNGEDVISDWNYTDGDADGFNAAMAAYAYRDNLAAYARRYGKG